VLDMGCGNGITAIELARQYEVDVKGFDFAQEMVKAATDLAADQTLKGSVEFQVGNVMDVSNISDKFDLIYTERTLINLPDWPTQAQGLKNIVSLLAPGGLYVMCENSQDGLDKINDFRKQIDLSEITPPWHNRYLRDAEVESLEVPNAKLEGVNYYSSTYYFLSRVVNAWFAAQEGHDPDYNAPVNLLALKLPAVGDLGQGRIWLWRKLS
jgi:ubiquinone/menaquinone biosynthesis C-methylase UbiE